MIQTRTDVNGMGIMSIRAIIATGKLISLSSIREIKRQIQRGIGCGRIRHDCEPGLRELVFDLAFNLLDDAGCPGWEHSRIATHVNPDGFRLGESELLLLGIRSVANT